MNETDQDEERRGHVRVDGEEQGQGSDRLLATAQVGHRLKDHPNY